MTSYSEVIPDENSERNSQQVIEKDKRFLIRQQLYYLFHAFRCTRLAYTKGQGDCQNQHCIMMRNVVKHITKCQLGKECTFQHCPSSKEIIKHWKNCNDVECQVCTPLRRNNGIRKQDAIINKDTSDLILNREQFSRENDIYGVNWRNQLVRIRPNLLIKLTDELLPVKVCEDVKNHSGYSEVSNYVKGFEMDIFQNSRNLHEYFYKLAEKFEFVYRNLLTRYQMKENVNLVIVNPGISRFDKTAKQIEAFYQLIKSHFVQYYPEYGLGSDVMINRKEEVYVKEEATVKLEEEPLREVESSEYTGATIPTENHFDMKPKLINSPINNTTNLIQPQSIPPTTAVNDTKMSPDSTSIPKKETTTSFVQTWTSEELLKLFTTIHEELFDDKDSEPFKYPVNWEQLEIPDYPLIIKHPMDLSTIKDKLINGLYSDPWAVVDDFWLMFNNAWLYNKKTSKVYKMCNTLAKIFESKIDEIMLACGYCCGREFVYLPQVLICCTQNVCLIIRDAVYYAFQNDNSNGEKIVNDLTCDRYLCCEKCYSESNDEVQFINPENNTTPCKVKKILLEKCRNNVKENEEFVVCRVCGRKWHKVCANYLEEIVKDTFACPNCIKENNIRVKTNPFKSKGLPQNQLSRHLEGRVNTFLREKDPTINEIVIRVLSISEKIVEVKPGMKSHYCETCEMPESFKYRLKAIFAFQEIDGHEVCFFGLHVQEYGSDCPNPNCRRVYISYLDSVHYFHPRQYRTDVYHEFLIGYLEYAKKLGYTMAHIWACPPGEGDDYIFHMHPPEQRLPKPKRLQEWYIKMLDKAMKEGIVIDYKDIFSDALHSNMLSPTELPYFDGDYWPNALEEIFKEIDDESNKRRGFSDPSYSEDVEDSKVEIISKNNMSKMDKKPKKRKIKKMNPIINKRKRSTGSDATNDVSRRVLELIEKRKENFFVIRLHTQIDAANLPEIADPDPLMSSDLMDGRDKFLCLAREKHLEFSSLRRAKFSTLVFCYELHQEQKSTILYTCNACSKQMEIRYTCRQCEDFELCQSCYSTENHPHPLYKMDVEEESSTIVSQSVSQPTSELQDTTRARMVRYSQSLQHACQCRDVNCRMNFCAKMKVMIKHVSCCTMAKSSCKICQSFLRICVVHAKFCNDAKCLVPNCVVLRFSWKQQGSQQRMQQAQMLRRRVALMQRGISVDQNPGSKIANQTPLVDVKQPCSSTCNGQESGQGGNVIEIDPGLVSSNQTKIFTPKMGLPTQVSYHSNVPSNNIYSNEITVNDDDVRLVWHQYNTFIRNFPIKEEFQSRFHEWLSSNPRFRMAYEILLKNVKRQNDGSKPLAMYQNMATNREQQQQSINKPIYPSYSQPHWQSDNGSIAGYPPSYNYQHNNDIQNNIVYDYQQRPMATNNPVYIASIGPGMPPESPMHPDSMHLNVMSNRSFPMNHGYVNGPNYINNYQNNSLQQRFPSQSSSSSFKGGQNPNFRCLPVMQHQPMYHHDTKLQSQHHQVTFPQYFNHNPQLDHRATMADTGSPAVQHSNFPQHMIHPNVNVQNSGSGGGNVGGGGVVGGGGGGAGHNVSNFNHTN